ncbi:unnamed protein product [Musa textilis]
MKLRLLLVVSRPRFSANQHKNHIHQHEQVDFSCYDLFFSFFSMEVCVSHSGYM